MIRLQLPFEEWPDVDKTMWTRLNAGGKPLDAKGPMHRLRNVSRKSIQVSYSRWLGWLSRHHPEVLGELPEMRATLTLVQEWMADLSNLRPETRLSLLEKSMRVLQKHRPDHDWIAHRRLAAIIRREARTTASTRKIGRVVSSDVLFDAGIRMTLSGSQDLLPSSFSEAKMRRDGMMVAFLAALPIRRRSFCSLKLNSSILVKGRQVFLALTPDMTKNKMVWEAELPALVAGPLLTYLNNVRPWFLARGATSHEFVWITDRGKPYCPIHLGSRISRITEQLVGVSVPPHFFRDCAATTLAYNSPDAARLSRAILGHKTFGVAERHYNQARAVQAGRDYAKVLENLRKEE